MAKRLRRRPADTLVGLGEPDVTGAEEAEAAQLVEFLRRSERGREPRPPAAREARKCGRRRRG